MNNKDFVAEVINGVKQAFDLTLDNDEIADNLYEFDPMLYGDWSLGMGGESDIIKLCGHSVEFVVMCEPDLPTELCINIIAGVVADADRGRAYELINQIEEQLGEEVVFNDISEDDQLVLEFNVEITAREQISVAIVDAIGKLDNQITDELLSLCDNR